MIDYAKITVNAGEGGNGAGSFRRIKGKRRGKADGGDGGLGGNVYVEATLDLNTLESYRFVKNYKAQDGQNGSSNLRRGANGMDLVLKVPAGTVVEVDKAGPVTTFPPASAQSSEPSQSSQSSKPEDFRAVGSPSSRATRSTSIFDLVAEGERILVARGGDGGRGNAKLRDEFGRRPKAGEKGTTGEACDITLELKLIADVGLIGLPNAGKSTLLAVLTSAKPQIAAYPFTTLEPNLGVLGLLGDWVSRQLGKRNPKSPNTQQPTRLILADIPGLIKGAAQGKGLGDLFLRHIERTKMLVHLIDVSAAGDRWQDYQTIRQELKTYSKDLVKKKEIIVLSKADLVEPSEVQKIRQLFSGKRKKVSVVSALKGEGLVDLVRMLVKMTNVNELTS